MVRSGLVERPQWSAFRAAEANARFGCFDALDEPVPMTP
jgi:hypothetical protein